MRAQGNKFSFNWDCRSWVDLLMWQIYNSLYTWDYHIIVGMLYPYTYTFLIATADGVPYVLSVFSENSAGNGTKCNVTDFTNELSESHYAVHTNYNILSC